MLFIFRHPNIEPNIRLSLHLNDEFNRYLRLVLDYGKKYNALGRRTKNSPSNTV